MAQPDYRDSILLLGSSMNQRGEDASVNLHGWDAVYAIAVDTINQALETTTAARAFPFSFSDQGVTVKGTLGAWSIVPGGSAGLVHLSIQLASASLLSPGQSVTTLTGITALFQVNLAFLPDPANAAAEILQFDFRGESTATGPGTVSFLQLLGNSSLNSFTTQLLGQAVAQCLVMNGPALSFVFASIDPSRAASTSWLNPVHSRYSVLSPVGSVPMFLIFMVMSDRNINGLSVELDSSWLGGNFNGAFAISPGLFLVNVFEPALNQAGLNGPLAVNDAGQLVNQGDLTMAPVTIGGRSAVPVVQSFTASVIDKQIVMQLSGFVPIFSESTGTFSSSVGYYVHVNPGTMTIEFQLAGTPTSTCDTHIALVDYLQAAAGIWTVNIITEIFSDHYGNSLVPIVTLTRAADLVAWAGVPGFQPVESGLATAFYVRGTFAAAS